jgi:hypothetical protein
LGEGEGLGVVAGALVVQKAVFGIDVGRFGPGRVEDEPAAVAAQGFEFDPGGAGEPAFEQDPEAVADAGIGRLDVLGVVAATAQAAPVAGAAGLAGVGIVLHGGQWWIFEVR